MWIWFSGDRWERFIALNIFMGSPFDTSDIFSHIPYILDGIQGVLCRLDLLLVFLDGLSCLFHSALNLWCLGGNFNASVNYFSHLW